MTDTERVRKAIDSALWDAREVHESNEKAGAALESIAYDAGRCDGLKQALEIIGDIMRENKK